LAHEVGFGKTLSGILSMHEAMERGNAKRPLIVVPNDSILKQWVETIFETIPNAKVNVLEILGKIMISQNLITKTEKLPLLLMKVLIILVFQKALLKI
jgi:N12 class adenine-specific DNA methylase